MKLYLLVNDGGQGGYDCYDSHLVRARNEAHARALASSRSGDEGAPSWLDPEVTSCKVVTSAGEPGLLLSSFNAG